MELRLGPELAGIALAVLILINGATYLLFLFDKRRAIANEWRASERLLLFYAFIGGWFGAKLAQRRFRHKTRKEPFRTRLNQIPVLWLLSAAATWWLTRG
ncbi:DUF1294 domain-containing protein [Marivita sp. S6314]|uniref:DUF1294 domain-containing protein n=1 Tax=Marivita sp. S6314 TaxID=2926406 RepID=UPI001FF21945|nr:DUF1294 domain-containing protein [Marivita sp. S6314]MCK0149925.1 DUF1294 domain-containing protein [Marivita sp. S6314]